MGKLKVEMVDNLEETFEKNGWGDFFMSVTSPEIDEKGKVKAEEEMKYDSKSGFKKFKLGKKKEPTKDNDKDKDLERE